MSSPTKKHKGTRMALHIVGGVVLLLAALLAAGYVYQWRSTAADRAAYPAPGQLVPIDGRQGHLLCRGAGDVTVVVDAGNGDFSLTWDAVQSQVAQFARICTYDRPGYGWSDPSPAPRTAHQVADELHALLHQADVAGPYLLVGHSLGGLHLRAYAARYPDDVVGMVLVDAAHEDQWERFPPAYTRFATAQASQMRAIGFLARFGLLRLMAGLGGDDALPAEVQKLPQELQETYLAMISQPSYFEAALDEVAELETISAQVREAGDLGDLPLVVLSAERFASDEALDAMGLTHEELQPVWSALQQDLLSLSSRSVRLVAEGSGHHVHLDRPDAVVDAIAQALAMVAATP